MDVLQQTRFEVAAMKGNQSLQKLHKAEHAGKTTSFLNTFRPNLWLQVRDDGARIHSFGRARVSEEAVRELAITGGAGACKDVEELHANLSG